MAIRDFNFIVGPETSTLPTATAPSAATDFITLSYANTNYARRASWYDMQATVASVKAIVSADRADGQIIWVDALTKFFYFDAASSATGDDVTVITPTAGTGRWLQVVAAAAGSEYTAVVANPAITGFSTHTTITAAIAAVSAGAQILVTAGTYSESVSVDKQLRIKGVGRASIISGNLTFTSASDYSRVSDLKVTGNLTFNSGSVGNIVDDCFVLSTMVYTDSNTIQNQNYTFLIEE